jgi:uncharacterized repeat protein (TIGR04076 family)
MAFCWKQTDLNRKFDVLPSCSGCRYHRRERSLQLSQIGPDGLCLEAFHAVYPTAFSMFSASPEDVENGVQRVCPAGEVVVSLHRRPFRQLKSLPEQLLRRLASVVLPVEVLRWRIFVRIDRVGECPYNYQPGDEYEVNIGNTGDLCPAAATNSFPYFVPFIQQSTASAPLVNCPDHLTNVRMSAGQSSSATAVVSPEDVAAEDVAAERDANVFCHARSDVSVEIVQSTVNCIELKVGESFTIADLLAKTGLPCLSYVNTIAAYVQTLRQGGSLGYYTETYRAAIVQCPSPTHKVVTRVEQNEDASEISFEVRSTNLECPAGMTSGRRFQLHGDEGYFWLRALACLSPYLLNPSLANQTEVTFSPDGPSAGTVVFRICADDK